MTRQPTQLTVRSAGLALNVVDFGGNETPAVLFVHGAFGHARVWDFVVEALGPGRRALAVDLPGHGRSEHAADIERYGFNALVDDVRAVVDAVGGRVVLAGHSLGSAIAMQYAATYVDTLAGAVFMDIDPCPPPRQAEHLNEAGGAPPRRYESLERAIAAAAKMAAGASSAVHRHLGEHGYRQDELGWAQRFDQQFLRSIRTWDMRPLLPRITVPALVIRGADSTVMSPEGYDTMLRLLPRAQGAPVPGAGHQVQLERPTEVGRLIAAFVAGLSS